MKECECIECGHTVKTNKRCKLINCPECGGNMRRKERPGRNSGYSANDAMEAAGFGRPFE